MIKAKNKLATMKKPHNCLQKRTPTKEQPNTPRYKQESPASGQTRRQGHSANGNRQYARNCHRLSEG